MRLVLKRVTLTPRSTVGELFIDDVWECFTLEDTVRDGPKVPGMTAIPAGTYNVIMSFSSRFQRVLPELLNVPGFTGIRIHAGNSDVDTDGCPCVGQKRGSDWIYKSRDALASLCKKLISVGDQEGISITVI